MPVKLHELLDNKHLCSHQPGPFPTPPWGTSPLGFLVKCLGFLSFLPTECWPLITPFLPFAQDRIIQQNLFSKGRLCSVQSRRNSVTTLVC